MLPMLSMVQGISQPRLNQCLDDGDQFPWIYGLFEIDIRLRLGSSKRVIAISRNHNDRHLHAGLGGNQYFARGIFSQLPVGYNGIEEFFFQNSYSIYSGTTCGNGVACALENCLLESYGVRLVIDT